MFGPNFWLHGQRNAAMFYWSHYTRAVRIKLKNTTDLFYRLGSILVTFLVIYLWFFYKVVEYISISPHDLQVQADLVCGAQSLVLAWDKLHIISWNKLLWLNTGQQLVEGILYLSIRWEWACIGHPKFFWFFLQLSSCNLRLCWQCRIDMGKDFILLWIQTCCNGDHMHLISRSVIDTDFFSHGPEYLVFLYDVSF